MNRPGLGCRGQNGTSRRDGGSGGFCGRGKGAARACGSDTTPPKQFKKGPEEIPGFFAGLLVINRPGLGCRGQNGTLRRDGGSGGFCGRGKGAARACGSDTTPPKQFKKGPEEIPGFFAGLLVKNRPGLGCRGQNGTLGRYGGSAGFCGRGKGAARACGSDTTPPK